MLSRHTCVNPDISFSSNPFPSTESPYRYRHGRWFQLESCYWYWTGKVWGRPGWGQNMSEVCAHPHSGYWWPPVTQLVVMFNLARARCLETLILSKKELDWWSSTQLSNQKTNKCKLTWEGRPHTPETSVVHEKTLDAYMWYIHTGTHRHTDTQKRKKNRGKKRKRNKEFANQFLSPSRRVISDFTLSYLQEFFSQCSLRLRLSFKTNLMKRDQDKSAEPVSSSKFRLPEQDIMPKPKRTTDIK